MRPELLQQQLPDVQQAQQVKVAENDSSSRDFAEPLTLDACKCPHLEALLPHVLDLKCIKNSETKKWQISNPVHSLHLTSHMGPDGTSINIGQKDAMIYYQALYGEEQRRTNAIIQGGVTGSYCPLEIPYQGKDNRYKNLESRVKQQVEPLLGVTSVSHALKGPNDQIKAENKSASVQIQSSRSGKGIGKKDIKRSAGSGDSKKQTSSPDNSAKGASEVSGSTSPKGEAKGGAHLKNLGHIGKMASIHPHAQNVPMETLSNNTVKSEQANKVDADVSALAAGQNGQEDEDNKKDTPGVASYIPPSEFLLSDSRYQQLRLIEERIVKQQKTIFSKRKLDQDDSRSTNSKKKSPGNSSKKRKNGTKTSSDKGDSSGSSRSSSTVFLPFGSALHLSDFLDKEKKRLLQLSAIEKDNWEKDAALARNKLEEWMEVLRQNRQSYWGDYERQQSKKKGIRDKKSYLESLSFGGPEARCNMCNSSDEFEWNFGRKRSQSQCNNASGDQLLQCLECSFTGCAPCSIAPNSRQHIIEHFIETNHSFGVTCGPRADLFCFRCGDFVYHEVFEQEKERIAISQHFPWMSWKLNPVQRSFDPLQFLTTPEHGVVWRGLVATYPKPLPDEYLAAVNRSMDRLLLFKGELESKKMIWGQEALRFATHQNLLEKPEKWKITAPIGMYNLGNTCFMSSVIQCLIHCLPLQKYFLDDVGHHHETCEIIRRYTESVPQLNNEGTLKLDKRKIGNSSGACLASEMDIIFLKYYGRTIGQDICRAVQDPRSSRCKLTGSDQPEIKGEPLIISDLLTAAWRTGDMDHLAGYEQRDAHEFLQAFLDIMGKHISQHRKRVSSILDEQNLLNATGKAKDASNFDGNIIKNLFEGTLRSVLMCEECGCKRSLSETFLNISLPLSKEMERSSDRTISSGTRGSRSKITVQKCLRHFTAPEALGDPVHCPSCKKKTATKKQHTFSKLPRILCLHLKRFDAANNKKIDDFVSFPAYNLDMGPHLPHWCEVVQGTKETSGDEDSAASGEYSSPQILYDLFGTVNHVGNLHQGHYTTNVKVDNQWFNCNDAFVSKSGEGDGERAVLKSEGAYVLFYIRR